jgi:hypothetical protein
LRNFSSTAISHLLQRHVNQSLPHGSEHGPGRIPIDFDDSVGSLTTAVALPVSIYETNASPEHPNDPQGREVAFEGLVQLLLI